MSFRQAFDEECQRLRERQRLALTLEAPEREQRWAFSFSVCLVCLALGVLAVWAAWIVGATP